MREIELSMDSLDSELIDRARRMPKTPGALCFMLTETELGNGRSQYQGGWLRKQDLVRLFSLPPGESKVIRRLLRILDGAKPAGLEWLVIFNRSGFDVTTIQMEVEPCLN